MNLQNYLRLWSFFAGHKKWIVLSILLSLVLTIMTLVIPTLSANLINEGINKGDTSAIFHYGEQMLIAAIIGCLAFVANTAIAVWAGEYAAHHLRVAEYAKIQTLSHGNIDRFRSSDLLIRLTTDVLTVKNATIQLVLTFPIVPFFLLGTIVLISINMPSILPITFGVLVALALLLLAYLVIVQPKYITKDKRIDEVNHTLREALAGIRVVKAFVRQAHEKEKFGSVAENLRTAATVPQYMLAYITPANTLILYLGITAIYFIGGSQAIAGSGMNIGDVTAAAQYLIFILVPVYLLSIILPLASSADASLVRIFEVLDAVPEIRPPEKPVAVDVGKAQGRVVFDHVSFGYRTADGTAAKPVLSDISFIAEPGQTVGILGATGSGKSTLVSLIPRFYDVTQGRVTIDGVDVRQISLTDLRSIVSICQQEPVLFSGTLRDTVTYGMPGMTDDRMHVIARAADADSFVMNIPDQYDSYVARRGENFSGGQRQRLAIARALARNPKVLILDDSTSACDVVTEAAIQDAIGGLMEKTTRIIIAQRISSVITADRILIMEKGRIIASGNHAELLKTCPEYQEIYSSQLGSVPAAGGAAA
ncbi:MAG: ABC transporter ATP-binding protein [Methanomicrobiales archaeon]|nr:ABC transporter ATP-binding protein [Methanomicrobiales archaeon]